jgi:dTDP-4-dehydrorhamnose 3,5-epimerase
MTARVIAAKRFTDSRGWFSETWNAQTFLKLGISIEFVQDNHSFSRPSGTLRGIHFQSPPHAQAKLVRCLRGKIFDIAVDLRRESPTFASWVGVELSAQSGDQLFIPAGYGHAFLTLEPNCEVAYKVDSHYAPDSDGGVIWNDPSLNVAWPLESQLPVLSSKDGGLPHLSEIDIDFPYNGQPLVPLNEQA